MNRKKSKNIEKNIEKHSKFIITTIGFLSFLSFLFTAFCVYQIYKNAYTTYFSCNKNSYICTIKKKDIFEAETVLYEFAERELNEVELKKKKNIINEEVHYLSVKNKETGKEYAITSATPDKKTQQEYYDQILQYLNFYKNSINFENSRYKLKFIGLSAAGASGLVALFLFIDCIKGIKKLKKRQDELDYGNILNSGRPY